MSRSGGGVASAMGGRTGTGSVAARSGAMLSAARSGASAFRTQGAFVGTGFRRSISSFGFPNRFYSTYRYPYSYYDNFVYYPYPYPYYSYATPALPVVPLVTNYSVANPPTYFGSCSAVDGVGVVQNNCQNLVAVPQAGNQCACYDRTSGLSGCMNVAGASCAPIVPTPFY